MIPVAEPNLNGNELKYLTECIKTNWVSSKGRFVTEFEEKFSEYCGCKYGVSTSNGTAALHLALVALKIGRGDEIIVADLTFISTANVVTFTGGRPIFVDSEQEAWNIDPEKIEEKITPKTKAIIPVHLYGHPCDMDPILDIAEHHNLFVIEDVAEAHGAEYKGKKVGSFGDIACFSFYGNKIITTGEGGMCLTDNKELAEKMQFFKNHGMSKERKYWYPEIGFNYKMTNLQAALGLAQLERIEEFIEIKRKNADYYNSLLHRERGITLPPEAKWAKNVYWMYSVLIEEEFGVNRDEVIVKLEKNGIETRPLFYPIHIMPPYFTLIKSNERFPVAEELSKKGISLPSGTTLKKEDIEEVVDALLNIRKV